MKSTALLTIALFFTVAPSPDSKILSELTGGFLKSNNTPELSAAELNPALKSFYSDLNSTSSFGNSF